MKLVETYNMVFVSRVEGHPKRWFISFSNGSISTSKPWNLTWRQLDAKLIKMGYYYVNSEVISNILVYHYAKLG